MMGNAWLLLSFLHTMGSCSYKDEEGCAIRLGQTVKLISQRSPPPQSRLRESANRGVVQDPEALETSSVIDFQKVSQVFWIFLRKKKAKSVVLSS